MTETARPLVYVVGQTVNTDLSPNTNAKTRATFDLNDTTYVTFYFQNRIPYWVALVSVATTPVTLDKDMGNNVVTFCKGLTVSFSAQGANRYVVFLHGKIIDQKTVYPIDGQSLGIFERSAGLRSRQPAPENIYFGP
jgi:hypothetical protein